MIAETGAMAAPSGGYWLYSGHKKSKWRSSTSEGVFITKWSSDPLYKSTTDSTLKSDSK